MQDPAVQKHNSSLHPGPACSTAVPVPPNRAAPPHLVLRTRHPRIHAPPASLNSCCTHVLHIPSTCHCAAARTLGASKQLLRRVGCHWQLESQALAKLRGQAALDESWHWDDDAADARAQGQCVVSAYC